MKGKRILWILVASLILAASAVGADKAEKGSPARLASPACAGG